MAAPAQEAFLAAGLAVFDREGFEDATVAAIRTRARASNGSFFHFFASKKQLAATLFPKSCSTITPRCWQRSIRPAGGEKASPA